MKKLFALGVLLLGVSPIFAQEKQIFPDVPPNHWAFNAVQKLAKEGLLQGYPEGEGVEKPVVAPTPKPQAKSKPSSPENAISTTPRVKMALINEMGLRGIAVDVDIDTGKQQVLLRGTALNQKQKDLAGAIARKHANGYKIVNLLKVIKKYRSALASLNVWCHRLSKSIICCFPINPMLCPTISPSRKNNHTGSLACGWAKGHHSCKCHPPSPQRIPS